MTMRKKSYGAARTLLSGRPVAMLPSTLARLALMTDEELLAREEAAKPPKVGYVRVGSSAAEAAQQLREQGYFDQ